MEEIKYESKNEKSADQRCDCSCTCATEPLGNISNNDKTVSAAG